MSVGVEVVVVLCALEGFEVHFKEAGSRDRLQNGLVSELLLQAYVDSLAQHDGSCSPGHVTHPPLPKIGLPCCQDSQHLVYSWLALCYQHQTKVTGTESGNAFVAAAGHDLWLFGLGVPDV